MQANFAANFSLDYDVVTIHRPQKLYLMAFIAAGPAQRDRQRRPLNLSLVIDRSGSMAGDKIDFTRQAAQLLVQNLSATDRLSIVLYNDKVETLLQPEFIQRKDIINQQIQQIRPGGTTNLSGGWLEGCGHVASNLDDKCLNRVILMSDGLANRGITQKDKLVTLAQQKLNQGISTTTMGLGADFNEDLLMEMANAGGGAFYFIESPEVTPMIFQEELNGLLNLVGQNFSISCEMTPYLNEITQLNAYPMSVAGATTTYRLGDVFGDEVKALILELSVNGIGHEGEIELTTLHFTYDEIQDDITRRHEWSVPVKVRVVNDDDVHPKNMNIDVRRNVLLLKAAQARQKAVTLADMGKFAEAAKILRAVILEIDESGLGDDETIREDRMALAQQAAEMEKGASKYNEYSRKMMSTQAHYTMTSRHDETVVLRLRQSERENPDLLKAPNADVHAPMSATNLALQWKQEIIPLEKSVIRIGRSSENDIIISVKGVSRFHCELRIENDLLTVVDLGSTNGTLVNGKKVKPAYVVSEGDVIDVCGEQLYLINKTS